MWDPHQKHLQDKLEMVQRRSERHSCGDFKPTSSASALVKMLNLDPLQLKRMSNKVIMLYKIAGGLINAKPREGFLIPTQNPTRGHESKFLIPYSTTETHRSSFFLSQYVC